MLDVYLLMKPGLGIRESLTRHPSNVYNQPLGEIWAIQRLHHFPVLARRCLAIILGTEIVFSSAPWSWQGPVYITMLAGHRQTQANNETGPSQGDPNNSSFTPRPRVSTERLSQNCTDTGPSIKMSAARLSLFDVGWCWPKNGCLCRHRGGWSRSCVCQHLISAHLGTHRGLVSHRGPHIIRGWSPAGLTSRGSPEAVSGGRSVSGSCVPVVFVISCAVSVTLLAWAACSHSGSHWRGDVHCVRCRDQLSTGHRHQPLKTHNTLTQSLGRVTWAPQSHLHSFFWNNSNQPVNKRKHKYLWLTFPTFTVYIHLFDNWSEFTGTTRQLSCRGGGDLA